MVLALGFAWLVGEAVVVAIDRFREREKRAIQGAEGEEAVGAILDRLPNIQVQHDVKIPYGNIDHLVHRKDGAVFVLETKSHRGGKIEARNGQLLRDGKLLQKDSVAQVQRNVAHVKDDLRARYGLTPWIHAAVVFTNAFVEPHCEVGHVEVINISYLERWMAKKPGQPELARRLQEGQRKGARE